MPGDDLHDEWQLRTALLAADVLPADEEQPTRLHLRACPRCAADLRELQVLTNALRGGAADESALAPSQQLGDRVVRAVQQARRRQEMLNRSRWVVGAAAAAITLLATGTLLPSIFGPPREDIDLVAAPAGVSADGAVVAHTWGTELEMVVDGLPVGETYTVQLVDRAGRVYPAGQFLGSERPVVCDMNAAVLRPDATTVQVLDNGGKAVLTADL